MMRSLIAALFFCLSLFALSPAYAGFASDYGRENYSSHVRGEARRVTRGHRSAEGWYVSAGRAIQHVGRIAVATMAGGGVHSKAGAHATVSPRYAAAFQALIDDIESEGGTVKFMGGYRAGPCDQRHKHPCGMALDICQYSRGVVDRRCNLPSPHELSRLAKAHGLFSGGDWCSSDYGHVEAGGSAACGRSWAAVRMLGTTPVRYTSY